MMTSHLNSTAGPSSNQPDLEVQSKPLQGMVAMHQFLRRNNGASKTNANPYADLKPKFFSNAGVQTRPPKTKHGLLITSLSQ